MSSILESDQDAPLLGQADGSIEAQSLETDSLALLDAPDTHGKAWHDKCKNEGLNLESSWDPGTSFL